MQMNTIEKNLAYFPLGISLLPGDDIPLRIFEPRYKQLIKECIEREFTFGIPFVKDREIKNFGTEVQLRQVVAENSLGEMVIVVEGISVFEILSFERNLSNKLYSGGKVRVINTNSIVTNSELIKSLIYYTDHFDKEFIKNYFNNQVYTQDIAKALNLSSEEKFKYISLNSTKMQEKFLLLHLNYLMRLREQEKNLNNDFTLN
jgi:uncharacterized protein